VSMLLTEDGQIIFSENAPEIFKESLAALKSS